MADAFTYQVNSARIVFGSGTLARVADEVAGQGCSRALVLSTASRKPAADRLAARLGAAAAGVFAEAAMHTPVEVTERALAAFAAAGADCVVAFGGGSTIGLGKAIAWRNGAPQVVVATTYAGSEVTPILGQTENGVKTTVRDAAIQPEVVIYDPELTLGLPVATSVASGLNAMAHAVEGLYARDRNPVASLMAVEGLRALKDALPRIVASPRDLAARSDALCGAWLCGSVLGARRHGAAPQALPHPRRQLRPAARRDPRGRPAARRRLQRRRRRRGPRARHRPLRRRSAPASTPSPPPSARRWRSATSACARPTSTAPPTSPPTTPTGTPARSSAPRSAPC